MRRHPLVALAAFTALASPAAPASASSDATHAGGCGWWMAGEPTHTGTPAGGFAGVLDGELVVTSPSAGLVGATVTCTYYFRGESFDPADVQVEELVLTGTGVVSGTRQVTIRGDVSVSASGHCETVDYADDTPTSSWCSYRTVEGRPTVRVAEAADHYLSTTVPGSRDAVCATFRTLGATGTTLLYVTSDGDLYYDGVRHWDC